MTELNEFFESIRGKLDYELDEESLIRKQAHIKEYAQFLLIYYKTHPLHGIETFKVEAISDTHYYVSYINTLEDKLPKSLFDLIGVVLERNKWYDAVIYRDFDSNDPIRVESVKEAGDLDRDVNIESIFDSFYKEGGLLADDGTKGIF